jgi:hypothetical protein
LCITEIKENFYLARIFLIGLHVYENVAC